MDVLFYIINLDYWQNKRQEDGLKAWAVLFILLLAKNTTFILDADVILAE